MKFVLASLGKITKISVRVVEKKKRRDVPKAKFSIGDVKPKIVLL
jgi:hypothetical protein